MKGRLWQCDRQWRRLASQSADFAHWPQHGRCFHFMDGNGDAQATAMADCINTRSDVVRFQAGGGRFELEKL